MNSKWTMMALLFSVAVNVAVVGTLIYFWQHNDKKQMNVELLHHNGKAQPDFMWFGTPPAPPTAKEIDSLRRDYHEKLVTLRRSIDADRQEMIAQLLKDSVDRDTVQVIIENLTEKQKHAERLTIDHLLEIKPLLPRNEWNFFIRDLRPRNTIRTQIIKLRDGDSTSILVDEKEIEEIQIFNHDIQNGEQIIKLEKNNSRRRP